jgi:hypothetical protein
MNIGLGLANSSGLISLPRPTITSMYMQLMSATPLPNPENLRVPAGAQDTRLFGSLDYRQPAPYSGPYGILLGSDDIPYLSFATDSAHHCVTIEVIEAHRGELV